MITTAAKLRIGAYAVIALAALIATWSQNLAFVQESPLREFLKALTVNGATRSITVDLLLFALAAIILMIVEARRFGVPFVWAYVVGGMLVAISVSFPLFLIAREVRMARADVPARAVTTIDTVLLVVVGVVTAAVVLWVDLS